MIEEKALIISDFDAVAHGSYVSNVPNVWSVAYRHTVSNGVIEKLDNTKRFLMRITAYEKFTGVDTTNDFSVTVSHKVAQIVKNGTVQYDQIAIARGRTSGEMSYASGYNPSTKVLTFNAFTTGNSSETVDVFYLIGEGQIRFQLASPAQAVQSNVAVFTASLLGINSKDQFTIKDAMFFSGNFEARSGFKWEIAVNTPATIILDARDISDASYTVNWNDIAILELPIYIAKEAAVAQATQQNIVEATNKQFNI